MERTEIVIKSRDYWFKVVEFLQQNWSLIDALDNNDIVCYFISDTSGVFDKMNFPSETEAKEGLIRNGFRRYSEDLESQKFISQPDPPFYQATHPNGLIYSSGRFWRK